MLKPAEDDKTTMIEVVSFLFFTLFAMVLAFFTSAKAFATPADGPACLGALPGDAQIAPCASDPAARAPMPLPGVTTPDLPRR